MEAIKEIYLVNLSNFWKVKYWMGFVVKKHSLKSFRSRVYTVAIAILTFNNAITTMTSKNENYIFVLFKFEIKQVSHSSPESGHWTLAAGKLRRNRQLGKQSGNLDTAVR